SHAVALAASDNYDRGPGGYRGVEASVDHARWRGAVLRRMFWALAVAILVFGAPAAWAKQKAPPAAQAWLVPAATITGLPLGLMQTPTTQFTPSSRPECAAFSVAINAARGITSSFAYQHWSAGSQAGFDDAVFVFPTQKAAQNL